MDRFLDKHHSKFTQIMDTIYFLVVTNFFAVIGTIIGLGVFGVFPSLFTVYELTKRRLNKEDFPIFKTFVQTYKSFFFKANKVGLILVFIWGILLASWFFYINDLTTTFHWVGMVVVGLFSIILFFATIILPISFVYFPRFKIGEHYRFSILMALGMPGLSLIIALNSLFFYGIVMIRLITIFPFLAFTLPAFINLIFARKKLMKLFTVYKDENVSIRTLNSFADQDQLWNLWQTYHELDFSIDYNDFILKTIENPLIQQRISLVLLDQNETLIGFTIAGKNENNVFIELLFVDPKYRKRGYGKKMMQWIENQAREADIDSIIFGDPSGYFVMIPRIFVSYTMFYRKLGYQFENDKEGLYIKKTIKGATT